MKEIVLACIFLIFIMPVNGQIKLDNSQSAEFYVKNVLLGGGIEVANIKHVGYRGALGQFEADSIILGINSGIILSTGNSDSINGPNDTNGSTSQGIYPSTLKERRLLMKGDRDLNKISHRKVKDIALIEFDFVPVKNKLEFSYVFASEEYPEFVGSSYNDVFAFFLSGPKIKKRVNLAVLPDGKTPISINTVNHKKNKQFYRKNSGFFKRLSVGKYRRLRIREMEGRPVSQRKLEKSNDALMNLIQFDGLTTVLKVEYDVIPYKKYHIKIAIGDGSDAAYDSAVFLEAGSFVSVVDPEGEHFEILESLEGVTFDIDSILGINDPTPTPLVESEIDETFEITDVYFSNNSSQIPDSSIIALDALAEYLTKNESFNCLLSGFTDNVGSKKHNQKLSENRAIEIRNYLISKGVSEDRIEYQGNNFSNPRMDNLTEEGRAGNRRVEILLQ